MRTFGPLIAAILLVPAAVAAQKSELDPTRYGVVYDVPATARVTVRQDIPFATIGGHQLKLDLYTPPGTKRLRPAVVFLNAIGDNAADPVKRWAIYSSWPRLVAAHDMVGISMDADGDHIQETLRGIFRFISEKGRSLGIDPDRLGVYAASANVSGAHAYLTSDSASPGIKAAVYYYGGVPSFPIRRDLPVFFVQAQSDAPRMAGALGPLWQGVVDSALPWTLVYGRGMPHAFDALSDTDDARRLIRQTLGFWEAYLQPLPAAAHAPEEGRSIVAAIFANDPARTVALLGPWLQRHPNEGEAYMHYGRMLAELRRFDEAETAYARAYQLDSTNPRTLSALGEIRIAHQQWSQGEDLLLKAVALGHENSFIHGQIGWARLHTGKNAEAVVSYERAIALGMPSGRSTSGLAWYNLACAYARLQRTDDAFRALNRAVDEGVRERRTFDGDDDLARLRTDPRYRQLLERMPA